jgi:hypothetical protein
MDDLEIKRIIVRGSKGKRVKLVQEWLCQHGFDIIIDGIFGPATEQAVIKFQQAKGLKADGKVGKDTFALLVKPMKDALAEIPADGKSLGQMVCAYAEQHLAQQPREIGGDNRGPWVRLYMDGGEGRSYLWCAGFVSFILKQACKSLNIPPFINTSDCCDDLARSAQDNLLFQKGADIGDKTKIKPGSIFLNFKNAGDWNHTGIVILAETEVFQSIEGNTNYGGNRNGYAALRRIRNYDNKDFIIF